MWAGSEEPTKYDEAKIKCLKVHSILKISILFNIYKTYVDFWHFPYHE